MADEAMLELLRQLRAAEDKYSYFLLAGAASGIALALNRTQGRRLTFPMLLLGLAVTCWGFSFFFGCKHLVKVRAYISRNFEALKVEAGVHEMVGHHPVLKAIAAKACREGLDRIANEIPRFADWQFRLLIAGALLYIVWQVTEMTLATVAR